MFASMGERAERKKGINRMCQKTRLVIFSKDENLMEKLSEKL